MAATNIDLDVEPELDIGFLDRSRTTDDSKHLRAIAIATMCARLGGYCSTRGDVSCARAVAHENRRFSCPTMRTRQVSEAEK